MKIPDKFTVAGGKVIKVVEEDYLINNHTGNYRFGEFNDSSNTIKIARFTKLDGDVYVQTDEDKYRTFLHELGHVFQFYFGLDADEIIAQCFSNFLYEYENSKTYNDQSSSSVANSSTSAYWSKDC